MGCDIHIYVERKKNDKWYNCDYFIPSIKGGYERIETCGDRNYALFATLADVRNYGNTKYICEPKGFPDDASDYVKDEYGTWFFDGHSCSYLTLQELIDFHNQGHPLKRRGMLSPEQRVEFYEGKIPDHWCQGTNKPDYEFVEWEEPNTVLVPLIEDLKRRADQLGIIYDFMWDGRPESQQEAYEKSANIRIVFWFDN